MMNEYVWPDDAHHISTAILADLDGRQMACANCDRLVRVLSTIMLTVV